MRDEPEWAGVDQNNNIVGSPDPVFADQLKKLYEELTVFLCDYFCKSPNNSIDSI
jgi:hypothetical protein